MVRRRRKMRKVCDPPGGQAFITPEDIPTAKVDARTMFGEMPKESECILMGDVFKVNHQCQWIHRCLALTDEILCFSLDKDDPIRDKILLQEVFLVLMTFLNDCDDTDPAAR